MIPKLSRYDYIFPDPRYACDEGLVAFGGDLSENRLLAAYKHGIFPWYSEGDPILWWSPNPRLVLYPNDLKISKSLKKRLKKNIFEIRVDTNFKEVIENCGKIKRKDQSGSWILPEVVDAYCKLFDMGFAHSVEIYFEDRLVGGLYGVSMGAAFFGESMFSKMSDASKTALVHLCLLAKKWKFDFIDCQIPSDHLKRMGAVEISRDRFLDELEIALNKPGKIGNWNDMIK
ncbi:leucyl/phenylalanyl-tRNA--protein transferase [Nitrosophilus alvini]|uniref:leucyl/phenylalanyl-tRNA--protein transferase n=1 Tax=Nitrosophilus alvini TaxID=2714855 RepID=UPI003B830D2C